ncbi:hypothetical protein FDP41_006738 [Naegleria fowleri]|uniref:Peptidase S8/S53 domain-containing protein n=1 Tax=Naegleria fowleri TaxID=5763 RepID=A0A6A5BJ89_NAEFO|nr:uncharacterized protein FDP41_006738 [Naegleria fowleri]KAF0974128.1 hypothetical protein FDP41_006738 [Naegleria fowleri]
MTLLLLVVLLVQVIFSTTTHPHHRSPTHSASSSTTLNTRILSQRRHNSNHHNIHLVHPINDEEDDDFMDLLSDFSNYKDAYSKIEKVLSIHNKHYSNDQLTLLNRQRSSTSTGSNSGGGGGQSATNHYNTPPQQQQTSEPPLFTTLEEESDHDATTTITTSFEIPQQFILKFKESVKLTEKLKQEFEKSTSIQLLQYIPDHSYLIHVTPSQLNSLLIPSQQQSKPQQILSKSSPIMVSPNHQNVQQLDVSNIISKIIPLSPSLKINPTLKHEMENERIITTPIGGSSSTVSGGTLIHIASSLVPNPFLTSQDIRDIAQQIRQVCERQYHMNVRFVRLISNRKIMLSVQLCSRSELNTLIDVLSHHPAVNWIERFDMERDGFMPENYHARLLIQGGKKWMKRGGSSSPSDLVTMTRPIGDTSPTAHRPSSSSSSLLGPFEAVGLTGKNQTVAISDSGLDFDHCFFYDPQVQVPILHSSQTIIIGTTNKQQEQDSSLTATTTTTTGNHPNRHNDDLDVLIQKLQSTTVTTTTTTSQQKEHRKIKAYVAFMDSKDGGHGHGSHTSGILTGQCLYPKSTICRHNGLAQDAKLVFF